jgi:hypothetical protein
MQVTAGTSTTPTQTVFVGYFMPLQQTNKLSLWGISCPCNNKQTVFVGYFMPLQQTNKQTNKQTVSVGYFMPLQQQTPRL